MAYIVKNVDVLDLKPSTGVGISVPFDGATGINTTYTTSDTIKSNLINFLLTGKRERVMNPSFGSGLREILFETEELYNIDIPLLVYFAEAEINFTSPEAAAKSAIMTSFSL